MDYERLTPGEIFLIEWQYHIAGGFKAALANAIMRADTENLARLEKGFPDEVKAYRRFAHEEGYWGSVQAKAGITC